MMNDDKKHISEEEKFDIAEFAEMMQKLPDKEKERFYYMMKGVELITESADASKEAV